MCWGFVLAKRDLVVRSNIRWQRVDWLAKRFWGGFFLSLFANYDASRGTKAFWRLRLRVCVEPEHGCCRERRASFSVVFVLFLAFFLVVWKFKASSKVERNIRPLCASVIWVHYGSHVLATGLVDYNSRQAFKRLNLRRAGTQTDTATLPNGFEIHTYRLWNTYRDTTTDFELTERSPVDGLRFDSRPVWLVWFSFHYTPEACGGC